MVITLRWRCCGCGARWDETWFGTGWWLLEDGKECDIALRGDEPTHWMPRPARPELATRREVK